MKKLSWIVMGLLFLSGIGMIAWSLFPMPVELVSGQPAGDKPEKTAAESDAITSNVLSDSNTIEISEDGATVIEPEAVKNSGGKEDVITEAAVFVPQTDPDDAADAGNYTLPEKAELKDGSIGVLTIDSIGVSAPVCETDDEMEAMRKGIAHYKITSAWSGNIGLCAHNGNASYCWFHDLHKVEKGDVVAILGSSGSGKTTMLKNITVLLSQSSRRVCVIDERREFFGREGIFLPPANVDVISGCDKETGIMRALRLLSPEFIICDEIGTESESRAVKACLNSGVRFIASIHAGSLCQLVKRRQFITLFNCDAFDRVVFLSSGEPGRIVQEYTFTEVKYAILGADNDMPAGFSHGADVHCGGKKESKAVSCPV